MICNFEKFQDSKRQHTDTDLPVRPKAQDVGKKSEKFRFDVCNFLKGQKKEKGTNAEFYSLFLCVWNGSVLRIIVSLMKARRCHPLRVAISDIAVKWANLEETTSTETNVTPRLNFLWQTGDLNCIAHIPLSHSLERVARLQFLKAYVFRSLQHHCNLVPMISPRCTARWLASFLEKDVIVRCLMSDGL